jgi:acetyl-CoA carboxylase carboxyltransferase component
VIEPAESRMMLVAALEVLSSKRDTRLPKKHANLPL